MYFAKKNKNKIIGNIIATDFMRNDIPNIVPKNKASLVALKFNNI